MPLKKPGPIQAPQMGKPAMGARPMPVRKPRKGFSMNGAGAEGGMDDMARMMAAGGKL